MLTCLGCCFKAFGFCLFCFCQGLWFFFSRHQCAFMVQGCDIVNVIQTGIKARFLPSSRAGCHTGTRGRYVLSLPSCGDPRWLQRQLKSLSALEPLSED